MNYIDLDAILLRHNLKDEPTNIFMCEKFVLNGPDVLVLACCSASGYTLPPMLLFNNSAGRRSLNNKMMSGEIPGTLYTLCDDYTIDSNVFEEWFSHLFLRHAPSSRPCCCSWRSPWSTLNIWLIQSQLSFSLSLQIWILDPLLTFVQSGRG